MLHSGRRAYDTITGYIKKAKDAGGEILTGGSGKPALKYTWSEFNMFSADDSEGFFVQPTVILTKDPRSITMREEIFGPVVTVCGSMYLVFSWDLDVF